jgi:hypothetical protein
MQSTEKPPVLTVVTGNLSIATWIDQMRREHDDGKHSGTFYVTCPLCQASTWRRRD